MLCQTVRYSCIYSFVCACTIQFEYSILPNEPRGQFIQNWLEDKDFTAVDLCVKFNQFTDFEKILF